MGSRSPEEEIRELRQQLTEERERFASLAESVPGAVYAYLVRPDRSTSFSFATAAIEQIYGVSREALARDAQIGAANIHPDDTARVQFSIEESERALTPWHCEWRMRHPERGEIWVEGRSVPTREADGGTRWYGIIIDITERKHAEQELIRSREKLEESQRRAQRIEALGTLAGGIAHDFNNILLAISGNARLALSELPDDTPADSPLRRSLREIDRASGRATELVNRMLAFSRRGESKREVIALQPIIEEAVHLLRASLPAMIDIEASYAPDAPAALADATQIHQVIMNLVTNAAHAIGSNAGRISIRLEAHRVATPGAGADDPPPGEYARITVTDTGVGMDRGTLERIFDPFFTTKPPGRGVGLGLSVVHGIVRNHGGVVAVESEPGRGATFRLYFPEARTPVAQKTRVRPAPPRGRGQRILYVDDEEALVYLVDRVLRRMGYDVVGVTDPARALDLFRQDPTRFDVVVTDLSMPGMSGFHLARALFEIRPETPVLMTSGHVRAEDRETARALGVRDLILKPDTIDELGYALGRLFEQAG